MRFMKTATSPQGHYISHNMITHKGGDQPHSHGAGSLEVASSVALDVAYVDVIIATKD